MENSHVADGAHRTSATANWREDERLLERIRARDLQAFEILYRSYRSRLTRFVINIVRRPQLVEEVFNDTMLVVWNRPDSFNGGSKLSTWIFAIAYRKALKALQRRDDPVSDPEAEQRPSPDPTPEQWMEQHDRQKMLTKALAGLSPDHRTVVDLTYFHEMGYKEIAEIMNCPVDTVKTRMFHARRHLRKLLDPMLSDSIGA